MKDYSVLTGLWKALKAAGLASLAIFVASLSNGGLDTSYAALTGGIAEIHLPVYVSIGLIAVLKFVYNLVKQYLASKKVDPQS